MAVGVPIRPGPNGTSIVPTYENARETGQRLDWQLLQNGFVTKFWSRDLFTATKDSLTNMGYNVVALDAGEWHTEQDALLAFGRALDFPSYYGRNLNALADCLRDVATFDHGSDPESEGTVIGLGPLRQVRHAALPGGLDHPRHSCGHRPPGSSDRSPLHRHPAVRGRWLDVRDRGWNLGELEPAGVHEQEPGAMRAVAEDAANSRARQGRQRRSRKDEKQSTPSALENWD